MNQTKLTNIWKRLSGFKVNTASWCLFSKTTIPLFAAVAIITALGWLGWVLYKNYKVADFKYSESIKLTGVITHLDEVLTMSAKMAAATGDLSWENRYRQADPKLDKAIKEAKELWPFDDISENEDIAVTEAANTELIAMENRAFDLIRQGNTQEALALLQSNEYSNQKKLYKEGLDKFTETVKNHSEAQLHKSFYIAIGGVLSLAVAISLMIISGVSGAALRREIKVRRQTEKSLKVSNQHLIASEQQLKAANQQLNAGNQQLRASQQQLTAMNQQLNASNQQLRAQEEQLHNLNHNLTERVKELNCLYGISEIVEKPGISLDEILQQTADIIVPSWQYPEITCAKISLNGCQYATSNFEQTEWKQVSNIVINNEKVGEIQVCYLQERPESYEGPFLKEERQLIDAVAERLGRVTERKQAESKFQTLYESSTDAIMMLDEKGFFDCNNATLQIFRCKNKTDFCSKHPVDMSPASQLCGTDSMKLANERIATAMETGSCHFEWLHKTIDGVEFPADVLLSRMELSGKKVLQAVVRDITEKKRAEQEIKMLSKFPGENPYPILRVENDGTVIYSNPAGKLLLDNWDCEVGEKIPEKWQKIVAKAVESAADKSATAAEEEEEEEVNGKIFVFTVAPIRDTNYVNIYARNITEYKHSIENLECARKLAEAANEAKG